MRFSAKIVLAAFFLILSVSFMNFSPVILPPPLSVKSLGKRVGILYSVDQGTAATYRKYRGASFPNIEEVIRGETKTRSPANFNQYTNAPAPNYYPLPHLQGANLQAWWEAWREGNDFHAEPADGYYCLYSPLATDPVKTECAPTGILTKHAALLADAGVDYIVIDLSNFPEAVPGFSRQYIDGTRPVEVLLKTWRQLRAQGKQTPDVSVFIPLWKATAGYVPMYKEMKRLYELYPDMILKKNLNINGKVLDYKILFSREDGAVVNDPAHFTDGTYHAELTNAGVAVIPMWAFVPPHLAGGFWQFQAPCKNAAGANTFSSLGLSKCNQPVTPNSPIGSMLPVAASYQGTFAGAPMHATGKLNGLTLARQFETAFDKRPDFVLLRSWNELIAVPINLVPERPKYNFHIPSAMGIDPTVAGNSSITDKNFVDIFGAEFSHAIEPTKEQGDFAYQTLKSCMRVYKKSLETGTNACSSMGTERCCRVRDLESDYVAVKVFAKDIGGGRFDRRLTPRNLTSPDIAAPAGFYDVPGSYPHQHVFKPGSVVDPSGPFIAYSRPAALIAGSPAQVNRTPIYHCVDGKGQSFYTFDGAAGTCGGAGFFNGNRNPIFYIAASRSSENPRSLRWCYGANDNHFFALDYPCNVFGNATTVYGQPLGYVR